MTLVTFALVAKRTEWRTTFENTLVNFFVEVFTLFMNVKVKMLIKNDYWLSSAILPSGLPLRTWGENYSTISTDHKAPNMPYDQWFPHPWSTIALQVPNMSRWVVKTFWYTIAKQEEIQLGLFCSLIHNVPNR